MQPIEKASEQEVARTLLSMLKTHQSFQEYDVASGRNVLYRIQVNGDGELKPDHIEEPRRGNYAYETDLLIKKRSPSIPLVVIELKAGSFTTHDIIAYSSKAERHKSIYPYLRYGFVVVGSVALGQRFFTHNQSIDFALAMPVLNFKESELIAMVLRQTQFAERLASLTRGDRPQIAHYEEAITIG